MKDSFVRKVFRPLVPILTTLVAAAGVQADTLVLNSGRRVEGRVIHQVEDSVFIEIAPGAEVRFSRSNIAGIIIAPVPERNANPPTNSLPVAPTPPTVTPPAVTPKTTTPATPGQGTAPATTAASPVPTPSAPPAAAAAAATAVRTPPPAKAPVKTASDVPPAVVPHTVSRAGTLLFPTAKVEGSPAMNALWEHSKDRPVTGSMPLVLHLGARVEVVLTNTLVYPATPARPEAKLEVAFVRFHGGGLVDLRTGRRVEKRLFEGWLLPDRLQVTTP